MSARVRMFSTQWCSYCFAARRLFETLGVPYEDIDVSRDPALRADMEARSGRRTVPQIWIGDRHMGGFDDVNALHARGMLMPLLTGGEPSAPASGE